MTTCEKCGMRPCDKCGKHEALHDWSSEDWFCLGCYTEMMIAPDVKEEEVASTAAAMNRHSRFAEFLIALGKLQADDIYVKLELDDIERHDVSVIIQQYVEKLEAARASDDPGKALDDFWRTILTHIVHRSGQVSAARAEQAKSRRRDFAFPPSQRR
jgi:hypothetical protein